MNTRLRKGTATTARSWIGWREGRLVLLMHTRTATGHVDAFCAVAQRQGRGLSSASLHRGLAEGTYRDLWTSAFEGCDGPIQVPRDSATALLARAVIHTRLAGRDVPSCLRGSSDVVGDVDRAIAQLDDVYVCADCGDSLSGGVQLALARGQLRGPVRCDECRGPELAQAMPLTRFVPRWMALAQLMLDAREPRRALAIAAHAERDGARGPAVARIRGWAHLVLGNAGRAACYLRDAVEADPTDMRTRALLVIAEAQSDMVVRALGDLDAMARGSRRPDADALIEPVRRALAVVSHGGDATPVWDRCLEALSQLEAAAA